MTKTLSERAEQEPQPKVEQAAQPAYLIAGLEVSDLERYLTEYGQPVFQQVIEGGGEVLVATPAATILEGTYSATWTVLIKFPSMEAIQSFYSSDRYQPLIPIRQALSNTETSILVGLPGFTRL